MNRERDDVYTNIGYTLLLPPFFVQEQSPKAQTDWHMDKDEQYMAESGKVRHESRHERKRQRKRHRKRQRKRQRRTQRGAR